MALMSVTWTLFTFPDRWHKFDLGCILRKGDQLFKYIEKLDILVLKAYPKSSCLVELSSINVAFLENETGKVTAGPYLISISDIVNGVQQTEASDLFIVNNYILGLIWGNDSIYLFDSHSKDENGNLSSTGTVVLSKFDTWYSLISLLQ